MSSKLLPSTQHSDHRASPFELTHPQTLERGVSRSSTDVGHDDQFENGDIRELNVIFLDLSCGVGSAEIPLLAHANPAILLTPAQIRSRNLSLPK
jgi:hypothetical protein